MRILTITLLAGALASVATASVAAPRVVARIKVAAGAAPCATAAGGGSIWVSEYGSPYLLRINPHTNKVVSKTQIGFGSCGLGFGAGSLWVEDTSSSTISRVSARTGKRLKAIPVGVQPYDATFAFGSAWATSNGSGEVDRIDPATNRVAKRFALPGAVGIVAAFGSVWAAGSQGVLRIDPVAGTVVATVPVQLAGWTAASADAVWVTSGTGSLTRIDPATNSVSATVALPAAPLGDPDVIDGRVWVPEIRANTVAIVDPATNQVADTLKVGVGPFVVTQIAGEAWIPSWKGRDILRVRP